jgi:hypothetical protein
MIGTYGFSGIRRGAADHVLLNGHTEAIARRHMARSAMPKLLPELCRESGEVF